jgi:hypothetical protein
MESIAEERVLEVRDYGKQLMWERRKKTSHQDNTEKNVKRNDFVLNHNMCILKIIVNHFKLNVRPTDVNMLSNKICSDLFVLLIIFSCYIIDITFRADILNSNIIYRLEIIY